MTAKERKRRRTVRKITNITPLDINAKACWTLARIQKYYDRVQRKRMNLLELLNVPYVSCYDRWWLVEHFTSRSFKDRVETRVPRREWWETWEPNYFQKDRVSIAKDLLRKSGLKVNLPAIGKGRKR